MSIYDDLTAGVAELTTEIDSFVQFTDNLFAALQVALANQQPAGAVAAVQAVIDGAKANIEKIKADIVKNTPSAP